MSSSLSIKLAELSCAGLSAGRAAKEKLLDKFWLERVLGQGAVGIVHLCREKATRKEFALKKIDTLKTPLAEMLCEARILRRLAHPCVTKLHDVFVEETSICLVLELYKGGNMINGMVRHWDSKGTIPMSVVQNITRMMLEGLAWLHGNSFAHRDIKGDNFLMECADIANPGCRIYLSDFGTARELQPRQRLTEKCGTQLYWAPEFYNLNYRLPVDIWALGVTVFGLATGELPFLDEKETRKKVVVCPKLVSKQAKALIMATLTRPESRRVTAQQALEHEFLSREVGSAGADAPHARA